MKSLSSLSERIGETVSPILPDDGFQVSPNFTLDKRAIRCLLDANARIDVRMRMLVSREGRLFVANNGIAEMFDAGSCLNVTNGVIGVSQAGYEKDLQRLYDVRDNDVSTLVLPCHSGQGHLLIRAAAMNETVVCLCLHHATEVTVSQLPDLHEVFGLTNAEANIVRDLFSGHTPQDIAVSHSNSVHTIRAHIRRCYDKLGISSREELWSKLNAYRLF